MNPNKLAKLSTDRKAIVDIARKLEAKSASYTEADIKLFSILKLKVVAFNFLLRLHLLDTDCTKDDAKTLASLQIGGSDLITNNEQINENSIQNS